MQAVAAIFDDGLQYPTLAVELSGAVTVVVYSRQLEDAGQSASFRHIVLQNGCPGKSGAEMQSESSAQCIPAAVEQAAPYVSAPEAGATQVSWKAFPAGTGAPTMQTRPLLQIESAPDCPYALAGSELVVWSVPQKLMGQTPPPMASAAQ